MCRMYPAMITRGIYSGKIGVATPMNDYGKVVFYPKEETAPDQVYLKFNDIEYLDERNNNRNV